MADFSPGFDDGEEYGRSFKVATVVVLAGAFFVGAYFWVRHQTQTRDIGEVIQPIIPVSTGGQYGQGMSSALEFPEPKQQAQSQPPPQTQAPQSKPQAVQPKPPSEAQRRREKVRLDALYAPPLVVGVGLYAPQPNGQVKEIPSVNKPQDDKWGIQYSSPYTLLRGAMIPAKLTTGFNSDYIGLIKAVVTEPVYDTGTGKHLLIPINSELVGNVLTPKPGQERAQILWDQINFWGGASLPLPGSPAADPYGTAGIPADVDTHFWEMAGKASLLTGIGALAAISQQPQSWHGQDSYGYYASPGTLAAQEAGRQFGSMSNQIIRRGMNRPPTLTPLEPETPIVLEVLHNTDFPGEWHEGKWIAMRR